jgi:Zn-dependent protease
MPTDPKQELLVALAGPAVNVALAVLLFGVIALTGSSPGFGGGGPLEGSFLAQLLWVLHRRWFLMPV